MILAVVDASVALKWFLHVRDTEPEQDRALSLLASIGDGTVQMVQPVHFVAEVTAVLAREKPDGALDDLLDLLDVECRVIETPETYATALTLSIRYRHHTVELMITSPGSRRTAGPVRAGMTRGLERRTRT